MGNQESTMPQKKPPFSPLTATKSSTQPPTRSKAAAPSARGKQQADKQWQRTKRYGWDSR